MSESIDTNFEIFMEQTEGYRIKYLEILIEKYGKTQHLSDEVDVATGKVVKINGPIKRTKKCQPFGSLTRYTNPAAIQMLKKLEDQFIRKTGHNERKFVTEELSEDEDCSILSDTTRKSNQSSYGGNEYLVEKRYLKSSTNHSKSFTVTEESSEEEDCSASSDTKAKSDQSSYEESKYLSKKSCLRSSTNLSTTVTEESSDGWTTASDLDSDSDDPPSSNKVEPFLSPLKGGHFSNFHDTKECCVKVKKIDSNSIDDKNASFSLKGGQFSNFQDTKECCVKLKKLDLNSMDDKIASFSLKGGQFSNFQDTKECFVKLKKIDLNSIDDKKKCSSVYENNRHMLVVDDKLKHRLKAKITEINEKQIIHINAILSPIKSPDTISAYDTSKITPLPCSTNSEPNLFPKFTFSNLGIGTLKTDSSKSKRIYSYTKTKTTSACSSVGPRYKYCRYDIQEKNEKQQGSVLHKTENILSVNLFKVDKQVKRDYNFNRIKTLPIPIRFSSVASEKSAASVRQENLYLKQK